MAECHLCYNRSLATFKVDIYVYVIFFLVSQISSSRSELCTKTPNDQPPEVSLLRSGDGEDGDLRALMMHGYFPFTTLLGGVSAVRKEGGEGCI